MKTEIADRWVAELRSGKYKQGDSYLNKDGKFCCLGVLASMVAEEAGLTVEANVRTVEQGYDGDYTVVSYGGDTALLTGKTLDYTGMNSTFGDYGDGQSLVTDNDSGKSFSEIADIIENHKDEL